MLAQDPVADERDRRLSRAVLPQGARRPPREPVGRVLVKTPRHPAVERLGGAARLPHARRDAREDILKLDFGARSVPSAAAAPARPTLVQDLGRTVAVGEEAQMKRLGPVGELFCGDRAASRSGHQARCLLIAVPRHGAPAGPPRNRIVGRIDRGIVCASLRRTVISSLILEDGQTARRAWRPSSSSPLAAIGAGLLMLLLQRRLDPGQRRSAAAALGPLPSGPPP